MRIRYIFLSCMTAAIGLLLLWYLVPRISARAEAPSLTYSNDLLSVRSTTSMRNDSVEPTPHPILSDMQVRKAVAYCMDKDALVEAAYPNLTPEERQELITDSFIPKTSWAYTAPATSYPYSPTLGQNLLDAAGWTLPVDGDVRIKDGKKLVLTLTSTDASMRSEFLPVFAAQMGTCGIQIILDQRPGSQVFNSIFWRDFELTDFAWLADEEDPGGASWYACDQIPSPSNNWALLNLMGWCNQSASDAIVQASNTELTQAQRKTYYATFINIFAEEVPSIPLFFHEGSTVLEHIDFNLQTYLQVADVTPSAGTVLTYTDYSGNQGTVVVPSGAVTQTISIGYYPEVASFNSPPANLEMALPFRINAFLSGVAEDSYSFMEPITVTVGYSDADIGGIFDENSLTLYYWDGESWQDAYTTCLPADRYKQLDTLQNKYEVRVCHLSEFSLMGTKKHSTYLPLTLR